ncbi:class E sortase [Curtobacterium ammoniigenes]|uniref:class E sortase n=1 Tax=Curtobacterium ammoniigenes TaxID=395387 RepID=UPI00083307D4|nr:class E sortase [Curtobacterium ammoniigenes]
MPGGRRAALELGRRLRALAAEGFIIAGIGCALFAVWTGWWTDVLARSDQRTMLAAIEPPLQHEPGAIRRSAPPVVATPGDRSVFATMRVPRFGADYVRPIAEGVDRRTVLNTVGLGHYPGTALPGGAGNVAIAGHRVTYGRPLFDIAELEAGDPIIIRVVAPEQGVDAWYVYRVTASRVVAPTDVDVIAPVPTDPARAPMHDERLLTLTACHPKWSAAERYVTQASFDFWMDAADGTPAEVVSR